MKLNVIDRVEPIGWRVYRRTACSGSCPRSPRSESRARAAARRRSPARALHESATTHTRASGQPEVALIGPASSVVISTSSSPSASITSASLRLATQMPTAPACSRSRATSGLFARSSNAVVGEHRRDGPCPTAVGFEYVEIHRPARRVQLFDPKRVRCKVRELDLAGAVHPVYSPDHVLAICLCCRT